MRITATIVAAAAIFWSGSVAAQTQTEAARQAMLARAQAAEISDAWVPPPGDPITHFTAAYAKLMCSAVFVSGFDSDFARSTLGDSNALAAVAHRAQSGVPIVDREKREVRVTTKAGLTRTARFVGDQGCVTMPEDGSGLRFAPKPVPRTLPDPATTAWPMGDVTEPGTPEGVDAAALADAINAAFAPDDALTQAFVVTWKGRIIAERYGAGATASTPLEGWSMGKSIAASLMGVLMQQGA